MIENVRKYLENQQEEKVTIKPKYELLVVTAKEETKESVDSLEAGKVLLSAYESLMTSHKSNTDLLILHERKEDNTDEMILEEMTIRVLYLFNQEKHVVEVIDDLLLNYENADELFLDIDIALSLVGLFDWKESSFNINNYDGVEELFISVGKKDEAVDTDVDDDDDFDFDISDLLE